MAIGTEEPYTLSHHHRYTSKGLEQNHIVLRPRLTSYGYILKKQEVLMLLTQQQLVEHSIKDV